MNIGNGQVIELLLVDGSRQMRIGCSPALVPGPGQYLLAGDGSDSPLPLPLFYTDSAPGGFIAAVATTVAWTPGLEIHLRGPLGRGFTLPASARQVGLVAFDGLAARLKGLIQPALKQGAAVALVAAGSLDELADEVEAHPLSALPDIVQWADYLAFDVTRDSLSLLRERLKALGSLMVAKAVQVLVHTPMPCGGLAECGICAVTLKSHWRLACKDGPVFDWREVI